MLAAWGIESTDEPVVVGCAAAARESTDAWDDVLTDLGDRGLAGPLLAIFAGAPGLINAVGRTISAARRRRCLVQRCRSRMATLSTNAPTQVKAEDWAIVGRPDGLAFAPAADLDARDHTDTVARPGATLTRPRWAAGSRSAHR